VSLASIFIIYIGSLRNNLANGWDQLGSSVRSGQVGTRSMTRWPPTTLNPFSIDPRSCHGVRTGRWHGGGGSQGMETERPNFFPFSMEVAARVTYVAWGYRLWVQKGTYVDRWVAKNRAPSKMCVNLSPTWDWVPDGCILLNVRSRMTEDSYSMKARFNGYYAGRAPTNACATRICF
jgi:hypothetical protein